MNPFRHQIPSRSPVPLRGLGGALAAVVPGRGDARARLGRLLQEEYRASAVVLLGSGTQALTLAIGIAGRLTDGEALVLPAYSCFDVAAAAVASGRPVRFYDIDPVTLGPDPASLAEAMPPGGGILVVVPLYGVPPDWDVLDRVVEGTGAVVIEDAAQGHGASWRGDPVGSRGDLSVLSFGRGKGWTGGGSGGALLLHGSTAGRDGAGAGLEGVLSGVEDEGAGFAGSLGTLGTACALWTLSRPAIYRIPRALPLLGLGETHYRAPRPPAPMHPSVAGFLLASRSLARAEAGVRREIAAGYVDALDGRGSVRVTPPAGAVPGYVRFPLLLPEGMDGFRSPRRARFLGAAPGYPLPLPALSELAHLVEPGEAEATRPGAGALVERLVTLPTHSGTRAEERQELVELIRSG